MTAALPSNAPRATSNAPRAPGGTIPRDRTPSRRSTPSPRPGGRARRLSLRKGDRRTAAAARARRSRLGGRIRSSREPSPITAVVFTDRAGRRPAAVPSGGVRRPSPAHSRVRRRPPRRSPPAALRSSLGLGDAQGLRWRSVSVSTAWSPPRYSPTRSTVVSIPSGTASSAARMSSGSPTSPNRTDQSIRYSRGGIGTRLSGERRDQLLAEFPGPRGRRRKGVAVAGGDVDRNEPRVSRVGRGRLPGRRRRGR